MAYAQQDYGMGAEYGYETEEERRRREEEERQREIEMMANTGMGLPAGAPASRSLGDIAGAYMNKRVDQAGQRVADVGEMFTDPQAAVEKRLGMTGGAVDTEPTPVKQTITTDPTTGEQKMKIEGSVRDLSAANSLTPTVTGPAVPTAMPPAAAPQAAPQMAAPQPRPMPTPVPAQLPAAGPINPNAPRPEIGQVPTPGPGVQVAGPATAVPPTTMAAAPAGGQTPAAVAAAPGASVAQIAQAAPAAAPAAPAEPSWVGAANAAGSDFGKLVDVAAKFPEARAAIQVKLQGVVEEQRKAQEAQRIVEAAQAGDPKAMNKLEQALRPTRGREREEVTTTDYLKAYMYARLGLNDLSAEVQAKIAGRDTKFGQIQLGNSTWSIETNAKTGEIVRAKDDEGNIATPNTLNKLSAAGQKFGTQAFGFTGEPGIVREADGTTAEVRQRTNSITGKIENIYVTGTKAGEVYTGTQVPQAKSVSTAAAKTDYNLAADLYKKHSGNVLDMIKEYEMIKGPMTDEGRGQFMRQYGYGTTVPTAGQATGMAAPGAAAPTAPTAVQPPRPGVSGTAPAVQPPRPGTSITTPAMPGTGGRVGGGVSTAGGVAAPISGLKAQQEIGVAGAKENIQVQGARAQSFNKILDEEVRPQAQAGDTVSSVRKQQFALFDRPGVDSNKLFGLYNAAAEGTGDQKASILRDIFGGIFKPEAEVSERLARLNLTPQEKSALMEYNTANQRVNAATLKQNAGPGAVSDAEQRANREANVDITKVPALGAFNAMAQSQFDGDRARWKADWALTQPAQNALQLDKAWRKENQRLGEMYRETATQRARFIAENGGTTAAVQLGYKRFPVPEYDPATETWKKTRPIGSYNR